MTLTSFSFFVFLFIVCILYYSFIPVQKYILLFASIYFYISISSINSIKLVILMLCVFGVTYIGALIIDHTSGVSKTASLFVSVILLVGALVLLKYAYNVCNIAITILRINTDISWLKYAGVIGISYYALTAIGYLIDVYWGNYRAAKNPVDVALFIFFFPQLISGPLTRFQTMNEQFNKRISLDYNKFSLGIRRMVWGYFKKLVISERFGLVVSAVYSNYETYSFLGIVGATLCYAIQLYTDFSGCMDIIIGTSNVFGIDLPENFNAPFFAETIQEFWQRWHLTLGSWFRDYFMYPVQKSRPIHSVAKWSKKQWGKKAGKKVPFYLAMMLLWILIGIWHGGTGYYFLASGGIPCILLMMSDLGQPLFSKIVEIFKINTDCGSWHWFRRIRTLFLVCVSWSVVCAGGVHKAITIFKHMFTTPLNYTPFVTAIQSFGLNALDVFIMALGTVALFVAHKYEYAGTTIMEKVDEQNFAFRILLIYAEVAIILFHGKVGSSAFIYFQF